MRVVAFVALLVCACVLTCGCGLCESETHPSSTTWSIREFYVGRSTLRPAYIARVTPHSIDVAPRVNGFLERQLVRLGVWLRVVTTTRPAQAGDWCDLPSVANATLHISISNASGWVQVQCNQALLFGNASLFSDCDHCFSSFAHTFPADTAPMLHLSSSSEDAAGLPSCVALPFTLRGLVVDKLGSDHLVMSLQLYDTRQKQMCRTYFEAMRVNSFDEAVGDGRVRSRSSQLSTILLLLIVIIVRFGPRYLLTRRGQLSTTSFRAGVRSHLLVQQQRREDLKRKTEALIAKLKAKDQVDPAA